MRQAGGGEAVNNLMGFSEALHNIKIGKRLARSGWNGKGMWIYLVVPHDEFNAPYIMMKAADGWHVPWLASQTDLLAVDWEVVA